MTVAAPSPPPPWRAAGLALAALGLLACVSLATVAEYSAARRFDDVLALATDEAREPAIRRAAVLALGRAADPRAVGWLVRLVEGEALGVEARSSAAVFEDQREALGLLAAYGPSTAQRLIAALAAVPDAGRRARLAASVGPGLGPSYTRLLADTLAAAPGADARAAVRAALAGMAAEDVRACYWLAEEGDEPVLPEACHRAHFDKAAWLAEPAFAAALEGALAHSQGLSDRQAAGQPLAEAEVAAARAAFQQALALDPPNPLARFGLARLEYGAGRFDEAAHLVRQVTAVAPEWGLPYGLLCDLHQRGRRLGKAGEACAQAVRLAPDIAWHHYLLGQVAKRRARFQEALEAFLRAVQLEPAAYGELLKTDLQYLAKVLGQPAAAPPER